MDVARYILKKELNVQMSIVHAFVHNRKNLGNVNCEVLLLFCQCSKRFAHTEHMKGFSLV